MQGGHLDRRLCKAESGEEPGAMAWERGGVVAQAIIPALGRWTQEGQLGVQGHFQPQVSSQPGLSEILFQKTKQQTKIKSSD